MHCSALLYSTQACSRVEKALHRCITVKRNDCDVSARKKQSSCALMLLCKTTLVQGAIQYVCNCILWSGKVRVLLERSKALTTAKRLAAPTSKHYHHMSGLTVAIVMLSGRGVTDSKRAQVDCKRVGVACLHVDRPRTSEAADFALIRNH